MYSFLEWNYVVCQMTTKSIKNIIPKMCIFILHLSKNINNFAFDNLIEFKLFILLFSPQSNITIMNQLSSSIKEDLKPLALFT